MDGFEHLAVGVAVELMPLHELQHIVDDVDVGQDAAENAPLRFEVLRGDFVEQLTGRGRLRCGPSTVGSAFVLSECHDVPP